MTRQSRTTFILGAGFSSVAHIPLQGQIPKLLISPKFRSQDNAVMTTAISQFLEDTFLWRRGSPIPPLEDIFTLIDLSAGSGHCLGRQYPPRKLRAIRRFLIHRVFGILDSRFELSPSIDALLAYHLSSNDSSLWPQFIVLNWDIALERHLERHPRHPGIDYGVNAKEWNGGHEPGPYVRILKVHGSSNWVYCDNCRTLFYDRSRKLALQIRAGLTVDDMRLFQGTLPSPPVQCPSCGSDLGPHIATFSFRKSFRTQAFSSSWLAAERALDESDRWIFIGYSLPDADYEFKHLLKTCQLMRQFDRSKHIEVVCTKDGTVRRYQTLLGPVRGFVHGLEGYVQNEIERVRMVTTDVHEDQ